ncbi:transglycosylase domain-containing protein, partial [Aeromicrobium sp.]|uniref:transglycosylase domain-containing protein n=1 Tax=Aeromicrobium sp. TaxID=1871063 RepID=UPI003D6A3876
DNATSGAITGGGSTITQQYVKILYLSQEQSYSRKIREAILSIKIHNQLSKQEILEGYLNTIYFGNGAYGVQVAAQTYFGKPASKLGYRESAALASVLNQPSYYDPYSEGGRERMIPRYNYVIDGMKETGAITEEQAAAATDSLPKFAKKKEYNRFKGPNGHLLRLIEKQMQQLEFTDSQILGGGLKITTTIGYQKQRAAIKAVNSVRPKGLKKLHTALVSVQPGNGAVRAMYGGSDYLKNQLNWATTGTQPGSTFKVFALIAALEDGFSLKSRLNGSSPIKVSGDTIENQGDSGGQSFGNVTLERATQKSINTAYVDLAQQLGSDDDEAAPTGQGVGSTGSTGGDITKGTKKIREAANAAGIPESITDKLEPTAAVTPLGYLPVPPVDMANAYATLVAGGKKAEWYVIDNVKDPTGAELHKHEVQVEQSIPEDVAGDAVAALQKVTNTGALGTGSRAKTLCPTLGKTGTATAGGTKDQHVSSSWFAGATPKLATAVMYNKGVGNEDLEGYLVPFFGGTYPAMTFKAYMDAAIDPVSCGTFPPPGNITSTKGFTYTPPPPEPEETEDPGDGGNGNGGGNGNDGGGGGSDLDGGSDPDGGGTDPDGGGTDTDGGGTDPDGGTGTFPDGE